MALSPTHDDVYSYCDSFEENLWGKIYFAWFEHNLCDVLLHVVNGVELKKYFSVEQFCLTHRKLLFYIFASFFISKKHTHTHTHIPNPNHMHTSSDWTNEHKTLKK